MTEEKKKKVESTRVMDPRRRVFNYKGQTARERSRDLRETENNILLADDARAPRASPNYRFHNRVPDLIAHANAASLSYLVREGEVNVAPRIRAEIDEVEITGSRSARELHSTEFFKFASLEPGPLKVPTRLGDS
jgi:hypothetical protein